MNVLSFPTMQFKILPSGYLSQEWTYFFSMNNQQQQLWFSNDGHLVPTRTTADLTALNTTQYTARSNYNGDTDNFVGNVAGTFMNYTMNQLTTRADIVAATPPANTIQQFGDENKNLYTNVNGTTSQNLTVPLTYPINITSDGSNLFVNINGSNYQFNLTPV